MQILAAHLDIIQLVVEGNQLGMPDPRFWGVPFNAISWPGGGGPCSNSGTFNSDPLNSAAATYRTCSHTQIVSNLHHSHSPRLMRCMPRQAGGIEAATFLCSGHLSRQEPSLATCPGTCPHCSLVWHLRRQEPSKADLSLLSFLEPSHQGRQLGKGRREREGI